jgi:hypothetical protein
MSERGFRRWLIVAVILAGCRSSSSRPQPDPAASDARPVASAGMPTAIATARATASASAAPPDTRSPIENTTPVDPKAVVACGAAKCHAGSQVCCEIEVGGGDPNDRTFGPVCVDRVLPGDTEVIFPTHDDEPLAREIDACRARTHAPAPETFYGVYMTYCDDSDDCPTGERCYFIGHHGSDLVNICVTPANRGTGSEVCEGAHPSCDAGTVCKPFTGKQYGFCEKP